MSSMLRSPQRPRAHTRRTPQDVSLIFSCAMYAGVRTIMTMQIVVYLLPWIGFTVCLVMNYRPYAAAVTATILQILYEPLPLAVWPTMGR